MNTRRKVYVRCTLCAVIAGAKTLPLLNHKAILDLLLPLNACGLKSFITCTKSRLIQATCKYIIASHAHTLPAVNVLNKTVLLPVILQVLITLISVFNRRATNSEHFDTCVVKSDCFDGSVSLAGLDIYLLGQVRPEVKQILAVCLLIGSIFLVQR